MTQSERRLVTFISWSGIVVGIISMLGYLLGGYLFDSLYGALAVLFFALLLYLVSKRRISYDIASILFSAFGIFIVTAGYITSISVEDGLIYMIIPTIIIALLRPTREAIVWLMGYYAVFFMLNVLKIPNYPISIHIFIQLFSIHMILFIIISYFRNQERRLSSQLLRANEQLQEEVTLDALTGAYNRRAFRTILERAVSLHTIDEQGFALALIDIDHFKRVNDNYGHLQGDVVLKRLAEHFKAHIRESDTLIRYGGEEFIICLCHIAIEQAMETMETLRWSVENLDLIEDDTITISIGVTAMQKTDTPSLLLSRADAALYKAKENGRNKVMQK